VNEFIYSHLNRVRFYAVKLYVDNKWEFNGEVFDPDWHYVLIRLIQLV